jgi:protein-S-isoprenylcysteine O-methyltransferase Ste14
MLAWRRDMALWMLRQLFAIAVLPFTVTVLVPIWLARRSGTAVGAGAGQAAVLAPAGGLLLLAVGALLFVASLRRLVSEGRGTLAPWDPPRHLVIRGPYRYVRNPMISGVIFVLFGEALALMSPPHAIWALIFLCANGIQIPLVEEPMLAARFGDGYREYCRHVPRLIPRVRPWNPPDGETL